MTPKKYAMAHRAAKALQGLNPAPAFAEAIYGAGFNSSGRFYEHSAGMLGMTPSQYRAGGANEDINFAVGQSSLGAILAASTEKGVAAILLGDDPEELVRTSKPVPEGSPHRRRTATMNLWWRVRRFR